MNIPESEGKNVEREMKYLSLQCFYVWKWFTNLDVIWMSWNAQICMDTNTHRFSRNKFYICLIACSSFRKTRPAKRVCPHSLLTLQQSRWFLIKPLSQLDAPQLASHMNTHIHAIALSLHSPCHDNTHEQSMRYCCSLLPTCLFFNHNKKGWLPSQWEHKKTETKNQKNKHL